MSNLNNNLFFCTSLSILDQDDNVYHGRTMEFSTDQIPSYVCYFPENTPVEFPSPANTKGLSYNSKFELLGVGIPLDTENGKVNFELCEGINSAGLSFSLNMKPDSELDDIIEGTDTSNIVPFDALGHWALANFSTVEEVKQGIEKVTLWTRPLIELGGTKSPFHFIFYDTTGKCIVVEISNKKLFTYDNPTGVMTNGPEFSWHLTNLNNYTHLTNIDVNSSVLGNLSLKQPDTGIATVTLPASDTSVDRFVRGVFYSSNVLKVKGAENAVIELSHIMNKFDRPKNITVSSTGEGNENTSGLPKSEFTVWTSLTDLQEGILYIRSYKELNYTKYDFESFRASKKEQAILIK